MAEQHSFLGRGWAFPPSFNYDMGTTVTVNDEEDIRQSIHIILGTIPGERIMFPAFGCPVRKFVFESNNPTRKTMLRDAVYDALLFNEPRIKIESIEIKDDTFENGILNLHINYTVIITNTRSNIVYPFYFKEGTML
ncbi:MAG: GPW/gp25 family protein [Draconibacterium sp.]